MPDLGNERGSDRCGDVVCAGTDRARSVECSRNQNEVKKYGSGGRDMPHRIDTDSTVYASFKVYSVACAGLATLDRNFDLATF